MTYNEKRYTFDKLLLQAHYSARYLANGVF
jgi:hypothetical protein